MSKKLTITISDQVYLALHRQVGRGRIAAFVERHLRPHLRLGGDLDRDYAAYAEWLRSTAGAEESADIDAWNAGAEDWDEPREEERWPGSWYARAGLGES